MDDGYWRSIPKPGRDRFAGVSQDEYRKIKKKYLAHALQKRIRHFPFFLCRKPLLCPFAIRHSFMPGDMPNNFLWIESYPRLKYAFFDDATRVSPINRQRDVLGKDILQKLAVGDGVD